VRRPHRRGGSDGRRAGVHRCDTRTGARGRGGVERVSEVDPKDNRVEGRVVLTDALGLHARPAVRLTQLAAGFTSRVCVRVDDAAWVDAKSIVKVMGLKARPYSTLHFLAEGSDADAAVR